MRTLTALAAALLVVGAVPLATAVVSPVDTDGDSFPDRLEHVLGTNPYDALDHPDQVAPNALQNSGFEAGLTPVSDAVTCPLFGSTEVPLPNPSTPLVIVSPCGSSALNGAVWSVDRAPSPAERVTPRDVDGDGDREMVISQRASAHNFWQSWVAPQQAFSADFRELTFDIEGANHVIPANARVQISVALSPFRDPTLFLPFFVECHLTFPKAVLDAHSTMRPGANGGMVKHIAVSPTAIQLGSYWEGCDDDALAWKTANEQQRRAMLHGMRIVQSSFWAFNGLVIDNVDLRGSTLPGP